MIFLRFAAAAWFALLLCSGIATNPAVAQGSAVKAAGRSTPPNGAEIAAAARSGTLDPAQAVTAALLGKPFKFTPARASAGASTENGVFLGVLENGAAGDETGLPPGKYNLFAAQVGGQWKGYAESNGQIVRQAIRASSTTGSAGTKPYFTERGWCIMYMSYAPPFFVALCF
jgi:hypothetical protein